MARRAESRKRRMPRKMKNTPNAVKPTPISATFIYFLSKYFLRNDKLNYLRLVDYSSSEIIEFCFSNKMNQLWSSYLFISSKNIPSFSRYNVRFLRTLMLVSLLLASKTRKIKEIQISTSAYVLWTKPRNSSLSSNLKGTNFERDASRSGRLNCGGILKIYQRK